MPTPPAMPAIASRLLPLLLSGACLAAPAAHAQARAYALDPVHTRVMFTVDHAGFSRAIGTVSGSTGMLLFDPEDWRSARLHAQVPMTAVDLGDERWTRATLDGNLLDAGDHPLADFVSQRVEPLAPDRAAVHGLLTLRGITRPLTLEVVLNALKRHPLPPFRRTVGFSATATLRRSDFGIDAWRSVIGDEVELRIEAEATRTRRARFDPAQAPERADEDGARTPATDAEPPHAPDPPPLLRIPPPQPIPLPPEPKR